MTKLIRSLTLVAALFAASIQNIRAQVVTLDDFMVLTNLSGSAFSNFPAGTISLDCSKQQNLAIEWTFWLSHATSVSNVALRFVGTPVSGSRPTDPTLADGFYVTRNTGGSTNLVVATNFTVKGYSRLDLLYATNNSSEGYLTNRLKYYIKRDAP